MNKPSAKVICHSIAPNGEELITMEVEFHRFILAEVNTHRVLSRNYSSSRAVPIEKMIEQVRNNPAIPVHWGKNQRGMVAENEVDNYKDFGQGEYQWLGAAEDAANRAETLNNQGYHKQLVNRILEPFIWTKGVITATKEGWETVFKLRCHKDAQPEFQLLANKIKEAIDNSVPNNLNYGEYHLPYVETYKPLGKGSQQYLVGDGTSKQLSLSDAIKVSCSCCAQVSYRTLDTSIDKAIKIYDMLNLPVDGVYPEDPPHFSPAEHVAKVVENNLMEVSSSGYGLGLVADYVDVSGNFTGTQFWQYRKALEIGNEQSFMEA